MLTLKRIYLYSVLGIALAVMLLGLSDILRIAFERVGYAMAERSYIGFDMRGELSWALALVIVSVPVFAVHLLLVRRSLQGPIAVVADERACSARATYFFLVLVATAALTGMRLLELGENLVSVVLGDRAWSLPDAAAGAVVFGTAWVAHLWARRRDLRTAPVRTAGDWLTRGYLYGVLFVTALLTCVGLGNVLTVAARGLLDLRPMWERSDWWHEELAWALVLSLVAGAAWAVHWLMAARLLGAAPPMGQAHRASRTRSGYFLAVVLAGAAVSLLLVSSGLRNVFAELAGTWRPTEGSRLIEEVGGPLLLALPFLGAWWWHLRHVTAEAFAFGGAALAHAARRAGRLTVALVGLAGLAIGVTWELQALLDAFASAGQQTLFSTDEVTDVTMSATAGALVGLAMWLPAWVLSQRDRARDLAAAATSTARRAYLFLVSGSAVVALMIALAFVIYQGTRLLLETELVDDASWAPAVLIVATVVLAYHLYCLRADLVIARGVEAPAAPAPPMEGARVVETIEISAPPGADFKVLNAAIRTELPEGYDLRVVTHGPA
jgi:hypothetical protein